MKPQSNDKFSRAYTYNHVHVQNVRWAELVLYAIVQPYLVIYGGQFPQLEEQIGSEPATFR